MTVKFSEVLRTLIKNKGITQTALAKELGLRPNVISTYCSGNSYPEFRTLIKLAEFFDVSLDSLIFGVRSENRIIAEELGLSDNSLENLKEIASQDCGLSHYVDKMLSNKDFFEVLNNSVISFEELATYYPIAEKAIKERGGTFNFEALMGLIENQAAMKMLPFFTELFKEENIIRGINDQEEYKRLVMKKKESQEAVQLIASMSY